VTVEVVSKTKQKTNTASCSVRVPILVVVLRVVIGQKLIVKQRVILFEFIPRRRGHACAVRWRDCDRQILRGSRNPVNDPPSY
jgi:hypothetical protein